MAENYIGDKMKLLFLGLLLMSVACTKSGGSVSPIQQVGCDVESAITGAAGSAIAAAISCSNQAQIASDVQTALGNVNLCNAGIASASLVKPAWSKVGDVTKQDLDKAKGVKSLDVKPMGVVGNIACPIVVNTLLGFATNSIPSSWGCSASTSASSLAQTIVAACELAVPL